MPLRYPRLRYSVYISFQLSSPTMKLYLQILSLHQGIIYRCWEIKEHSDGGGREISQKAMEMEVPFSVTIMFTMRESFSVWFLPWATTRCFFESNWIYCFVSGSMLIIRFNIWLQYIQIVILMKGRLCVLIETWFCFDSYCKQESHPESHFRVPAIVNALENMQLTPKVILLLNVNLVSKFVRSITNELLSQFS